MCASRVWIGVITNEHGHHAGESPLVIQIAKRRRCRSCILGSWYISSAMGVSKMDSRTDSANIKCRGRLGRDSEWDEINKGEAKKPTVFGENIVSQYRSVMIFSTFVYLHRYDFPSGFYIPSKHPPDIAMVVRMYIRGEKFRIFHLKRNAVAKTCQASHITNHKSQSLFFVSLRLFNRNGRRGLTRLSVSLTL